MAVIKATYDVIDNGAVTVTWSNLSTGDTGSWEPMPHFSDKTVHVSVATGGAAQSVSMQGTNEPISSVPAFPATLNRTIGTPLTYTSTGPFIDTILENPIQMRPNVAGTGMAGVTITVNCSTNR
jgi:hypothetical protein